jgi:hypothetical protein
MSRRARSAFRLDRGAVGWGLGAVAITAALATLGSGGLRWFDAALVGYLFGTLFAVFGCVYRYRVWLRRPPTATLHRRSWQALWRPGARARNLAAVLGLLTRNVAGQTFIRRRSTRRWLAHQLVFWGCVLAAAVTFPLVFGWLHFESVGGEGFQYRAFVGNVATVAFDARGVLGWLVFHALDVAAVLVVAGVLLFLSRRVRDPGAIAVERATDFLALAGLFAVSVTGLMLTASTLWMGGRFYTFLTTVHALTVILGLMYIPFGKLFHIFQRPANLGVHFYREAGAAGPAARCPECGTPFAAGLQMSDLKEILPQLGFDYGFAGGHYQDVCPPCRRRLVTLAQGRRVGGFG